MKKGILLFFSFLFCGIFLWAGIPIPYAESTTEDEARELRESKAAERAEEAYRKKPETAADILRMLKERAEIKLKLEFGTFSGFWAVFSGSSRRESNFVVSKTCFCDPRDFSDDKFENLPNSS